MHIPNSTTDFSEVPEIRHLNQRHVFPKYILQVVSSTQKVGFLCTRTVIID